MAKTNEQVAACWVHGKDADGSNLYSRGPELVSYGTTIGLQFGNYTLLSADNMSPTTARHLCHAARATGCGALYVNLFEFGKRVTRVTAEDVVFDLVSQVIELGNQASRARSRRSSLIERGRELFDKAVLFGQAYGVKPDLAYPSDTRKAMALAVILQG